MVLPEDTPIDCEKIIMNLSNSELKAYVDINQRIDLHDDCFGTRTELGNRKEQTLIIWWNGSKKWSATHPDAGWWKGKDELELRLGPQQMLVPYPYAVVNKFAGCLKTSPLYHCSTEAWTKGEVSRFDAHFCWDLKQLERIKREEWQEKNK